MPQGYRVNLQVLLHDLTDPSYAYQSEENIGASRRHRGLRVPTEAAPEPVNVSPLNPACRLRISDPRRRRMGARLQVRVLASV